MIAPSVFIELLSMMVLSGGPFNGPVLATEFA